MSDLSAEARTLIRRAGNADGPTSVDRERVRRRMMAALAGVGTGLGTSSVAAGASLATAAAAKGGIGIASVAIWFATGASLGAVVATPAIVSRLSNEQRVEVPSSAPVVEAPLPVEGQDLAHRPAFAPETPSGEVVEAKPATLPGGAPATRAATSSAPASLAEETRLLETAQRDMAQGRPERALAALDEHARRFPNGALGPERSAARVFALCALGRHGEATRAAEAFVAAAPRSPLVPRLRASCAALDAASSEAPSP